jgi:hypothetical protein
MKRHKWVQIKYELGYKEQKCSICGAVRWDPNIYIRQAGHWHKAMLNGKPQPYCQEASNVK